MKKIALIGLALALCVALLFGINRLRLGNIDRTEFETEHAKISLDIDEELWYVFTRDNLYDYPALDEVWVDPQLQIDFILENNIFLDAVLFYSDVDSWLELLLVEKAPDVNRDYSALSEDELEALAEEKAEEMGGEKSGVLFNRHGLKFIWYEYCGEGYYPYEYYIRNYYTEVDGKAYDAQFIANVPFIYDEYRKMERIINSMRLEPLLPSPAPSAQAEAEPAEPGDEAAPAQPRDEAVEVRPEPSATELLKQVVIALFIYSLPVVLYRFSIVGEPVDEQKSRKITIVYACFAAALMLLLVIMGYGDKITLGAIILWSYMNYRILIDY